MNYADLTQSVADILFSGSPDEQWASNVPRMIESATLRIFRDLEPVTQRKNKTVAFNLGSTSVNTGDDVWVIRSMVYLPTGVDTRTPLQQRSPDFLEVYSPSTAVLGTPKYWCIYPDMRTIRMAPKPNIAGNIQIAYTAFPDMLSETISETDMTRDYPDMFLYACLVFAAGYIRDYGQAADDPKLAMSWEARYQSELAKAVGSERLRKSSGIWDNTPTPPPSSSLPTG